jgi:hypothetical protein
LTYPDGIGNIPKNSIDTDDRHQSQFPLWRLNHGIIASALFFQPQDIVVLPFS